MSLEQPNDESDEPNEPNELTKSNDKLQCQQQ